MDEPASAGKTNGARDAKREARKVQASSFTDELFRDWAARAAPRGRARRQFSAARGRRNKGFNMSSYDLNPDDGSDETGGPSRGSTHAVWLQRRQAKRRTRVRAKRRRTTAASMSGMHLRRNKRVSW